MSRFFHKKFGRRGIAAVEFALIFPVLIPLFLGTIEILTLYRTEAKLNAIAFNVAQGVSIADAVSTATAPIASTSTGSVTSLNDLCKGAVLGLKPFPTTGLTIAIASITEEAGPNGQPTKSPAYSAKGPYYDEWESDSTVSNSGTCATPSYSSSAPPPTLILSGTGAPAPINVAMPPAATSMITDPCDNVIIVQASLTYAGLLGLMPSRPTLTQTAYVRWRYALPTAELQCTGCTLKPVSQGSQQICNTSNTATN